MGTIDPAVIDHIAALARLALTDDERRLLADQLGAILSYVDQLQALDLGDDAAAGREDEPVPGQAPGGDSSLAGAADVLPGGPGPDRLALRPDVPSPSLPRAVALAGAPGVVDGYVRVPPVLGETP